MSHNALLLWTSEAGAAELEQREIPRGLFSSLNASDPPRFLRYSSSYQPIFKFEVPLADLPSIVAVDIDVLRNPWLSETEALIAEMSLTPLEASARVHHVTLRAMLSLPDRLTVAARPDVLSIRPESGPMWPPKEALFVRAPPGVLDPSTSGVAHLYPPPPFSWRRQYFKVEATVLDSLPLPLRAQLADVSDLLNVPRRSFDTQVDPLPSGPAALPLPGGKQLRLVQFIASPSSRWVEEREWGEQLAATSAVVVRSLSSGGKLLWTDEAVRTELAEMEVPADIFMHPPGRGMGRILKFNQPLHPDFKIDLRLLFDDPERPYQLTSLDAFRHADLTTTLDLAQALSAGPVRQRGGLMTKSLLGWFDRNALESLARQGDVISLRPGEIHNDATQVTDRYTVLAAVGRFAPEAPGVQVLAEVGEGADRREVVRISDTVLNSVPLATRTELTLLDDDLHVGSYRFDSQDEVLEVPAAYEAPPLAGEALHVIQFIAYPEDAWMEAVEATGARLVKELSSNSYVVWADATALAGLAARLVPAPYVEPPIGGDRFLQYLSPLHPYFRIAWFLLDPEELAIMAEYDLRADLILATHDDHNPVTMQLLESATGSEPLLWNSGSYRILEVGLPADGDREAVVDLMWRPDVLWLSVPAPGSEGPSGFVPPDGPGSGPSSEPGTRFDPNVPGIGPAPDPAAIPTLGPTALALLSLLLVAGGWWALRASGGR